MNADPVQIQPTCHFQGWRRFGRRTAWAAVLATVLGISPPPNPIGDLPRVLDQRLKLTLFAENPVVTTPIGIAVDSANRVFVLESHTHLRPPGYQGPSTDLVKMLVDADGDGQPERVTTFADGLIEGLNLAFSPQGVLYAVTSRTVWALYDRDNDGVCDAKEKVLDLTQPASVYAHAALLGITFSPDGWMYVSRGNTGGQAWKLVGTDGSSVEGYGDGGNIVRARNDGSKLEEVATGFWNPMDLKFDAQGRLLAADNDPDSRGPNRLVHVVPGGDYGYKSLYGGSGIHPYLAWNGELPGTLPYAASLGEAPSGLLATNRAALPSDYRDEMLSSIWEESKVVRIKLTPKGASVVGETQVLLEGGPDFRPVAFAADRTGAIYITDWVLRDYPNHGRGRIWKLAARPGIAVAPPHVFALNGVRKDVLEPLSDIRSSTHAETLKNALASEDAFVRHAATVALAHPALAALALETTEDTRVAVRLGALVALQRSSHPKAEPIARRLLAHPDPLVRQRTLQWAGEAGLIGLRSDLDRALTAGLVTADLFDTYLETIAHLAPAFQATYRGRAEAYAKSIKRPLPPRFLETFVNDPTRAAFLRALALRYLPNPEVHTDLLLGLLKGSNPPALRVEAIRSMAAIPSPAIGEQLLAVAKSPGYPEAVRAEALLALARQPLNAAGSVKALLNDPQPDVRLEALRYLRMRWSTEEARRELGTRTPNGVQADEAARQQVALMLPDDKGTNRPRTLEAWEKALTAGGMPERGRRVFYSVQASCSACHRMQGRGGDLGPDLTNVGQSKSRAQLLRSILRPSAEISPEWQGWFIRLKNGEEHRGRQIDVGDATIELQTQTAGFVTFPKKDITDYGLVRTSLMPEGLEAQLTEHDLRDLLAFLQGISKK